MVGAAVARGLAAGLLAGLLAGLVGLVVVTPTLEDAIALEAEAGHGADTTGITRSQQRVGLVVGSGLLGLGVGAVFGVASAWAVGRVAGDVWQRSLKLGAATLGAVVLLPALKYPANPPGFGDPGAVGARTTLYLGLAAFGVVLAATAWAGARQLAGGRLPPPVRQVLVGTGVVAAAVLALVVLPAPATASSAAGGIPPELLWSFRLGVLATQVTLYGGTAVLFGLLAARGRRHAVVDQGRQPVHEVRR